MPSDLSVAVLALNVTHRGVAVSLPDRELQLLVALALSRDGLRREEICELLWPDLAFDAARVALKSCTYRLRSRLGEHNAIAVADGVIRLDPGATVDVWEIGEAVAEWRSGNETSQAKLAKLRALHARLPQTSAPQLTQWEWFADKARGFQELRVELAGHLAEAALAAGDAGAALELAREIEAYDATDELGCALAIRALRLAGDELGADRVYRRYAATLRRELDVEPSPALERLHRDEVRELASAR